jgi:hypothetical protein
MQLLWLRPRAPAATTRPIAMTMRKTVSWRRHQIPIPLSLPNRQANSRMQISCTSSKSDVMAPQLSPTLPLWLYCQPCPPLFVGKSFFLSPLSYFVCLQILPYDQENLERFFVSFWAAYDGKALNVLPRDKEPTLNAFLSSLLECIVFISRKLHMTLPQSQNSGSSMAALAGSNLKLVPINWIANILTELVGGDLARNISEDAAGALVGGSIRKLELINSG